MATASNGLANLGQLVLNDDSDKAEVARLRTTNSLYDKYAPRWTLQVASYEGGPMFACRENLNKHARETAEDYNDRVKRLHYLNYCAPIVDFFTNFIFAETIQRDPGPGDRAFFDEFVKNVNLRGDTIEAYMRDISDDMQIFGMVYSLVDAPTIPDTGRDLSAQELKDLQIRPYWLRIRPLEVLDWVRDEFNNFRYLKRQQHTTELVAGEVRRLEKYTEWYEDKIRISLVDVGDLSKPRLLSQDEVVNQIGSIPVYLTIYQESKEDPEMAKSFLNDLAYNARQILNITSMIDEFLAKQCFAILVREADSSIPTREQNQGEVGTANALEVPRDAKFPLYIAPPAEPAKFLQDERERIKLEMFRRAAQDTMDEVMNGTGKSGFSHAQSFSRTMPHIATRADQLERTELALFKLTYTYMAKDFIGAVKYKDDYAITNFTDAVTQLVMLCRDLLQPSELFVKTELKRLVHEYDGKVSSDDVVKIEAEIDAMDFKGWLETQKEALVGQPKQIGGSPASQQKPKASGTMKEVAAKAQMPKTAATTKLKGK